MGHPQAVQRPGSMTAMLNYYRCLVRMYLGLLPVLPEVSHDV